MKSDISLVEHSSSLDTLSSSDDNRIVVASDKCVYVLEQTINTSFRHDFLCLSKEVLKDNKEDRQHYDVGVDTNEIKKLPRRSYSRQKFALNRLLHDDKVSAYSERFLAAKLSPVCDGNDRSILATLSNNNHVVVYFKRKGHWIKVENISDKLYEYAKKTNFTLRTDDKTVEEAETDQSTNFEECQRRTKSVTITGLEWSAVFHSSSAKPQPVRGKRGAKRKHTDSDADSNSNSFVLLATALKSNHLILWKFQCPVNEKTTSKIAEVMHTNYPKTTMHWFDGERNDKAYLATGGYNGLITVWSVSTEGSVTCRREVDIWEEKDDIPVQAITSVQSLCTGESYVLLAAKGPFVFAFQMRFVDGNMKITNQSHTLTLHNALVSGICNVRDKMCTSSTDGSIQVAKVKQDNDGISLDLHLLEPPKCMTKINGICASNNGIYLTTQKRLSSYATLKEKSNLTFKQIATDQEVEDILMEPQGRLCNKFDCLDWLYQRLPPDGSIQNTTKAILSEETLVNKTPGEILYLLKLRRLVVMMILHRLSRELYNYPLGRKRDDLDEIIQTKETHVKEISDRIFKLHVEISLETLSSGGGKKTITGRTKRVQKLMSDWLVLSSTPSEEPITANGSLERETCESCRLCGESIPLTSREDGFCRKGHRWNRCSLSLLLCQSMKPRSCAYCKSSYASKEETDCAWLRDLLSSYCLWCDGPLIER
ncbi:uncharacterized protein LOC121426104 [Lytechinus variegatus]|uniref:uncharacterized protein LOC121426104 n=1 Tax=Lytechinus variegatus TaxID=7654 RepID=UPI001BB15066|nr:uncharacterized protein LOC121426104 [Lytechinus variegatus]